MFHLSALDPYLLIAIGFDCLFIALKYDAPPVSFVHNCSLISLCDVEYARDKVGSLHRGASRPPHKRIESALFYYSPLVSYGTEYPYSPHCSTVLFCALT